ncbi:MAG: hypothetical protein IPJ66_19275 [Bacteroidetes bacterium]|nr:hypothetical protein [Bacteroidota bacterium]MBL0065236.1 hypothetical protein [Bacteroidota bacterium]MBL0138372.1 hypothetical protein [Bacteroidota bacterium]
MSRHKKQSKPAQSATIPVLSLAPGYFFTHKVNIQALIVFLLGFILYTNTIPNEYALDDGLLIKENKWVQKGSAGIGKIFSHGELDYFYEAHGGSEQFSGGRYRPLSIATFAIEQSIFGDNPHVRHFFNALLYAITLMLMLYFLRKYIFPKNPDIAFLATILFALHPIHSEVVANIKSRNELLPFLFYLTTLIFSGKYIQSKKMIHALLGCVSLFLSLLSKEYGILFIVLLPLYFILILQVPLKKSLLYSLPYYAVMGVYTLIRISITRVTDLSQKATEEVLNNQYILGTMQEKLATKVYLLSKYFAMLFYPWPLSSDYSYNQIEYIQPGNILFIGSVILHLLLIGITIYFFLKKKNTALFFMLFYFAHLFLISNLAVEIGTTFSERLMYIISFPFCVLLAMGLIHALENLKLNSLKGKQTILLSILVVIALVCTAEILPRNAQWKNDFTLFTHDVKVSTNSVLVNANAAKSLINEAVLPENENTPKRDEYLSQGVTYLLKSIEIYPRFANGYLNLGVAYFHQKKYEEAFTAWMKVKEFHRSEPKLKEFAVILKNNGLIKGSNKDFSGAIQFLNWASQLDESNDDILYNLGGAYFSTGNYEMAKKTWEHLLKDINPNHAQARNGLNAVLSMPGIQNTVPNK